VRERREGKTGQYSMERKEEKRVERDELNSQARRQTRKNLPARLEAEMFTSLPVEFLMFCEQREEETKAT